MRNHLPLFWLGTLPLLLLFAPTLRAEKLVLARSQVSGGYLEKRRQEGGLKPQTYVFMPGRFLAGNTHDRSLERFSFQALAGRLASDLRRQEFHPAASLAKADLLLVVHWGATAGRNRDLVALSQGFEALADLNREAEEIQGTLDQAISQGDFEAASQARGNLDRVSATTRSEQQTVLREGRGSGGSDSAALLGFTAEMNREDGTLAERERRKTLFDMTTEECYFVVVMAYDARALTETKKLQRVWTLRVSINTAGVNFPEALDRISNVASHYFGVPQPGVAFDYPPERNLKENINIDNIVVLGPAEP